MSNQNTNTLLVMGKWSLCLLALIGFGAMSEPAVRTAKVIKQPVQSHKRVTGTLKAALMSNVASKEDGVVTEVLINEGQSVKQGQALLQLDDRKLQAQKQRLKAQLASARARYAMAKEEMELAAADFKSYQYSANKQAISDQRLRQAQAQLVLSKAKKAQATEVIKSLLADIQIIDIRIGDMRLNAPIDGQAVARMAEPGQWLGEGSTAFVLTSQQMYEAWLDVPERFAQRLLELQSDGALNSIGLRIGDRMYKGQNIRVLRTVDNRVRTFKVLADVVAQGLMEGMSLIGWIPDEKRNESLTVPKDAIVSQGNNTYVFRVNQNGEEQSAEQIEVIVDFYQGEYAAITSNALKHQDDVVIEGNIRLVSGPVTVILGDDEGAGVGGEVGGE